MNVAQKIRNFSQQTYRVAASRPFFTIVVVLAVIQGLWFAFTFRPVLFDELRHLQFIEFYSHHLNPFIANQTSGMDALGQVTREPSYLYYYVMSLFLRAFQVVTSDPSVQTILLRMINITLFVLSLYLFRKLFRELKVSEAAINVTLLAFILIPAVGPIIGAVTYDIGVLPLIALMMLYTVRILKNKSFDMPTVSLLVIVVCLASVVKYTSLPIALVCIVMVLVHYGKAYWGRVGNLQTQLQKQIKKLSLLQKILLSVALVVSLGLFIERPVRNLVVYKDLAPSCFDTLSGDDVEARCAKNYVYQRDLTFLSMKSSSFVPVDQVNYFFTTWLPGMHSSMVQQYLGPPLQPMVWLYYIAMFGGIIVVLLGLRSFLARNPLGWLLLIVTVFYMLSVYYSNYKGYAHLAQPVAITARYLIPVLPLCIYMLIASLQCVVSKPSRRYLPLLGLVYILASTQGGGIITHLVSANEKDYWQNDTVKSVNNSVKSVLLKLTKS